MTYSPLPCRFQGSPAGWLGKCDSSAEQQSPSGGRNNGNVDDDDDEEVDVAAAAGLTALADALAAIMGQLGAKAHVWALGPASSAIGVQSAAFETYRGTPCTRKEMYLKCMGPHLSDNDSI